MPGRTGSKKRNQNTRGGASSPRRGSRSRSVSQKKHKRFSQKEVEAEAFLQKK